MTDKNNEEKIMVTDTYYKGQKLRFSDSHIITVVELKGGLLYFYFNDYFNNQGAWEIDSIDYNDVIKPLTPLEKAML